MEGDHEDAASSPFWVQSSNHSRRRLTRSSSLFFNSGAFLVVLAVGALAFVFVVLPSVTSLTSTVFRPQSVKKSWDSLNIVLVLFAVVCGFLSRNGGNETGDRGVSLSPREGLKSSSSTPRFGYSDRSNSASFGYGRLRSSSSYPDLRQESPWTSGGDERWRFHDDMEVSEYRPSDYDHHLRYRRRSWRDRDEVSETKNIEVDTVQIPAKEEPEPEQQSLPPRSPSPPPPMKISPPSPPIPKPPLSPPQKATIHRKPKRSYEAIRQRKEETENPRASDFSHLPPPAPPPPPPLPEYRDAEQRNIMSEKKIGVATKEFLNSLRRKKKKQRQRSVENFDSLINSIDPPTPLSYQPPPPPPPPPPQSVFQSLFSSKKSKARKNQSSLRAPPPPPPPPPPRVNSEVRVSKNRAQRNPVPMTFTLAGNESPLIPIPPPPPPPPFKVHPWKFTRRGDFVRIKSDNSTRSASPEPESAGDETPVGMSPARGYCQSPDVDTKADNFIARFRAGLILEKENSFTQRDAIGKSRLSSETSLGRED